MSNDVIRRLQLEVEVWRARNYGACHPWEQLLGVCEEYGESCEGMGDSAAFADSIGDSAIYLLNFCTSMGWDAGELYELRDLYEQPSRPWPILVGRLAHHYVKGFVQNYRGTREEHEARGKAAASALFATWERLCAGMGTTFEEVLTATWAEVSKRDWSKERETNAERNPLNEMFGLMKAEPEPRDTERPPAPEDWSTEATFALLKIGRSCVSWSEDTDGCHLCDPPAPGAHVAGCPVGDYMLATTTHGRSGGTAPFAEEEINTFSPVVAVISDADELSKAGAA